jgi:hypothetical protein
MLAKKIAKVLTGILLVSVVLPFASCKAQMTKNGDMPSNPFITDMYTADPSAHVWKDGRLYVYASHDIAPPRGCDLMVLSKK